MSVSRTITWMQFVPLCPMKSLYTWWWIEWAEICGVVPTKYSWVGWSFDGLVSRWKWQRLLSEGEANEWQIRVPRFSFIHSVVCLTTGPKLLPKRALHIVRSRASSFKWEYPLISLTSSSSFLRLLPRLSVTSIPPFIFPLITRSRRQFLRKMQLHKYSDVDTLGAMVMSIRRVLYCLAK
jgi:hypothetical protein